MGGPCHPAAEILVRCADDPLVVAAALDVGNAHHAQPGAPALLVTIDPEVPWVLRAVAWNGAVDLTGL